MYVNYLKISPSPPLEYETSKPFSGLLLQSRSPMQRNRTTTTTTTTTITAFYSPSDYYSFCPSFSLALFPKESDL